MGHTVFYSVLDDADWPSTKSFILIIAGLAWSAVWLGLHRTIPQLRARWRSARWAGLVGLVFATIGVIELVSTDWPLHQDQARCRAWLAEQSYQTIEGPLISRERLSGKNSKTRLKIGEATLDVQPLTVPQHGGYRDEPSTRDLPIGRKIRLAIHEDRILRIEIAEE